MNEQQADLGPGCYCPPANVGDGIKAQRDCPVHAYLVTAEQQGGDESGEGLDEGEREDLCRHGVPMFYPCVECIFADRLAALQAEVDHWKSHAEEAGRGFDRVCRDAARISAARVSAEAALATARRDADELRAERDRWRGSGLQRALYDGEKAAGWDPDDANTLAEEIAHLHEEVSEIFRAFRLTKTADLTLDPNGKPQGVAAECADVAIGLFYIAERWGFDLLDVIETKHAYNLTRSYADEGRRLHDPDLRAALANPSAAQGEGEVERQTPGVYGFGDPQRWIDDTRADAPEASQ